MDPLNPNQQPPQTPPQAQPLQPFGASSGQPQQPAQPAPQPPAPAYDPWVLQQPAQPPVTPQAPVTNVGPAPYVEPRPSYAPSGMASIDYLNQISAPTKKSFGFSRKQLWFVAAGLILAVGVLGAYFISNAAGPSNVAQGQRLLARTTSLSQVVSESQDNIKASALSSLNSSLSVQLTGTNTELIAALGKLGVGQKNTSETILREESNTELLEKLDDARLSGYFDRVYMREVSYELQTLLLLMHNIEQTTQNSEAKAQLGTAQDNLEPLHTQLVELSETTS